MFGYSGLAIVGCLLLLSILSSRPLMPVACAWSSTDSHQSLVAVWVLALARMGPKSCAREALGCLFVLWLTFCWPFGLAVCSAQDTCSLGGSFVAILALRLPSPCLACLVPPHSRGGELACRPVQPTRKSLVEVVPECPPRGKESHVQDDYLETEDLPSPLPDPK
eukprot:1081172-Amphidinium_carterae.1